MKAIIAVSLLALLTACGMTPSSSPIAGDGYQFGDLTDRVLTLQARYCAETDPRRRAVRLAALRAAGVPVPASGACTDILALIPEPALDVDVEQAETDQRRFEGLSDADTDTAPAADDSRPE